uniref:G-protein coupled receptors family 1 profile domain-containing protein n=1 Tax=Plectus sambesii TaxID=2011161 RepID=A0A914WNR7_9BILA
MAVQLRNRSDGQWEQVQPQAVIDANMRNYIIYGIEGLLMTLTNLPIVLSVLRYKALRDQKEFIIVAGLAFADGFHGFAYLSAAIGRINLLLKGDGFVLKSRWHCGTTVWNISWTFANNLAGLMLLVVSIDRLIAVSIPLRYFTFTKRYACILVGSAFAYICIPATVSFVLSYQYQKPEFPAICQISNGMHDGYYKYLVRFHLVTSFGSVFLYGPVIFMLKRTLRRTVGRSEAEKISRLKKVTYTLGIHTCFTFLFNMVPDLLMMYSNIPVANQTPISMMLNLNAMVNIFIYTLRFKEMRNGLKALIMCRAKLPAATANAPRVATNQRICSLLAFISSKLTKAVTRVSPVEFLQHPNRLPKITSTPISSNPVPHSNLSSDPITALKLTS